MKNTNTKISDSALKKAKENLDSGNKEKTFAFLIISIFFGGNSENRELIKSLENDYLLNFNKKFGDDNFLGYILNRVGADGNVCINTSNSLFKKCIDNLDPRAIFIESIKGKCDFEKIQNIDFGDNNSNILITSAEASIQGFDIDDNDIDNIVDQLININLS